MYNKLFFVCFSQHQENQFIMAASIIHRKDPVVTKTDGQYMTVANEQVPSTERELKEHNGTNGFPSWIAIKGKVYNVSNFGK